MLNDEEEMLFREAVFAWIRARQLHTPFFTRDDLSHFFAASRKSVTPDRNGGVHLLGGVVKLQISLGSASG